MNLLSLFNSMKKWPCGQWVFSKLFCMKAPYFGSIKIHFDELEKGRCKVSIKKRRSVLNHIGTVHAIAMCNMAEAAAGTCLEVSLPKKWRWIPKGMTVEYLKKASTNLTCLCEFNPDDLQLGENKIEAHVLDSNNEQVFKAIINMYISEKKKS